MRDGEPSMFPWRPFNVTSRVKFMPSLQVQALLWLAGLLLALTGRFMQHGASLIRPPLGNTRVRDSKDQSGKLESSSL